MPTFTMPAHEKDFILNIHRRMLVEPLDLMVETLPLCHMVGLPFEKWIAVYIIGAIDESKIDFSL